MRPSQSQSTSLLMTSEASWKTGSSNSSLRGSGGGFQIGAVAGVDQKADLIARRFEQRRGPANDPVTVAHEDCFQKLR